MIFDTEEQAVKAIDHVIKTGEGISLEFYHSAYKIEIYPRTIPEPEGPRPDKPLTWKSCKASMDHTTWFNARAVQRLMIDNWLTEKAKNIEERKTLRRLEKIKKAVINLYKNGGK